jgi:hypothetical protein
MGQPGAYGFGRAMREEFLTASGSGPLKEGAGSDGVRFHTRYGGLDPFRERRFLR